VRWANAFVVGAPAGNSQRFPDHLTGLGEGRGKERRKGEAEEGKGSDARTPN